MLRCPECGAENPASNKHCGRCGELIRPEPTDRFKTLMAILIAIVSLVGAVLAWRAAEAESAASDADVRGTVSIIQRHQALVASESEMYRNLSAYLQVRIHDALSLDLMADSERRAADDPKRTQYWHDGWTEIFVAEAYLTEVDIQPEYIRPDGSYDGRAAQDIDMAERSLGADFDPLGQHFAQADQMRTRVLWLIGLMLLLTIALLCYTLASVIERRLKYLLFALGSALTVLVVVAAIIVELGIV